MQVLPLACGSIFRIWRMAWMNPMSSMRSASSSTQTAHLVELEQALLRQIEQPPRGRDDDIAAAAQRLDLRASR